MTTLVQIAGGFRNEIEVQETFEQAINKVYPLQPPTSSLEGRTCALWTDGEGKQRMIPPQSILQVIE